MKLVLIGSSTGGPGHIDRLIRSLGDDFQATIIIAQHMSPHFVESFARQVGTVAPMEVVVANKTVELKPTHIYVCSGECQVHQSGGQLYLEQKDQHDSIYTPDIDTLFLSAAKLSSSIERFGVIITGIGDDGAKGALALHNSGGKCMFESEESAIVYGMPRRAHELVPEAPIGTIDAIIDAIMRFGRG